MTWQHAVFWGGIGAATAAADLNFGEAVLVIVLFSILVSIHNKNGGEK